MPVHLSACSDAQGERDHVAQQLAHHHVHRPLAKRKDLQILFVRLKDLIDRDAEEVVIQYQLRLLAIRGDKDEGSTLHGIPILVLVAHGKKMSPCACRGTSLAMWWRSACPHRHRRSRSVQRASPLPCR